MFDIATAPQPTSAGLAQLAVPLDWRLTRPTRPQAYPYTELTNLGGPQLQGVDMLATYALALEGTLATAVVLSLFTDARAGRDDALPRGADPRGWVGDEYQGAEGDAWGSKLWLLYTGKVTGTVLEAARYAAADALQWLVRDGIAERVEVQAQWAGARADRLALRVMIYQPTEPSPVYDVLWGTSLQRWGQAQ